MDESRAALKMGRVGDHGEPLRLIQRMLSAPFDELTALYLAGTGSVTKYALLCGLPSEDCPLPWTVPINRITRLRL